MKFHTKVASFGINDGQSYALCMLCLLVVVILALFIYMPSRGVGGSHALHGAFVYCLVVSYFLLNAYLIICYRGRAVGWYAS